MSREARPHFVRPCLSGPIPFSGLRPRGHLPRLAAFYGMPKAALVAHRRPPTSGSASCPARPADRRVSPGAAQHPQRHALTPLDGRLLTLTCLRFEHQDCWSRRTAGLWVAVPCVRSAPHSLRRSSPGHSQPTSSYRCCPYYIPIRPSPPNRADCANAWLGCIRFLCARLS